MMIKKKKAFTKGIVLSILFFVVLALMFSPLFDGQNAFKASDKLFNSMAKGSTNYFPKLKEANENYKETEIEVELTLKDAPLAKDALLILTKSGFSARQSEIKVNLKGNLSSVIDAALVDAEALFFNKGEEVVGRYDIEERRALFTWWRVLLAMSKSLNHQKKFKEAAFVDEVTARGVEVGYNFYKIEPESAKSKAGILVLALVFYVVYTLWWGFAVYFLTEGFGLELSGGHKKET